MGRLKRSGRRAPPAGAELARAYRVRSTALRRRAASTSERCVRARERAGARGVTSAECDAPLALCQAT